MKLTKTRLKQLIKEELRAVLKEIHPALKTGLTKTAGNVLSRTTYWVPPVVRAVAKEEGMDLERLRQKLEGLEREPRYKNMSKDQWRYKLLFWECILAHQEARRTAKARGATPEELETLDDEVDCSNKFCRRIKDRTCPDADYADPSTSTMHRAPHSR